MATYTCNLTVLLCRTGWLRDFAPALAADWRGAQDRARALSTSIDDAWVAFLGDGGAGAAQR